MILVQARIRLCLFHTDTVQIIRIWLNLFVNSLMPSFFSHELESEFFTDSEIPTTFQKFSKRIKLPKIPLHTPQVIDRAARPPESGLFSALSSYISSYAADDPPEPSKEEEDSALTTRDCIMTCKLGDVFAQVS